LGHLPRNVQVTILVCGSRQASRKAVYPEAYYQLGKYPPDTTVIHGDCKGADTWAALAALQQGKRVIPYPADWKRLGRAAGPLRNQRMLSEGKPDLILAFPKEPLSGGTKDMVDRANKAGIPVRITWI
jgi:YspA, cpYpsA-related SLOG family